ncbi:MAG TPA: SpoVR family protein [Symbiobacteriaceae bacterium]|nr:SpoVR family protein [Symbiobacteriaceae bacterium]
MDDREVPVLEEAIGTIWEKAKEMGLDPYPTHFEIVPASILYEFGAYLLPGRFSHWTHGKAYYTMKASYDYGLSKIYELVINANPSYAFLLDTNTLLHNKFVVAHVFGHTDFFKHNAYFEPTNRQMIETVSQNAQRIRQYSQDEGSLEVERFLDAVLSISDHIDHYPRRKAAEGRASKAAPAPTEDHWGDLFPATGLSSSLMTGKQERKQQPPQRRRVPTEPEKDLLYFLLEHADGLDDWQRDVISIVREESLYFVPQMQTKIMNEGWASYWHSHIMRELDLTDDEFVEFGRLHCSVCTPGQTRMNPYYVGLKIFEDIEKRLGQEKIFEVRELENDVSFIRSYLTEELCRDLDLYVFKLEDDDWKITDKQWERVRDTICEALSNHGTPYIVVEDGDYRGHKELYLKHHHDGKDLDTQYAEKTLQYVERIWGRPVHLETKQGEKTLVFTCDCGDVSKKVK